MTGKIKRKEVFVVKNTMIRNISEIFCPHNCISCGKVGGILCHCCKNDILVKHERKCLVCGG
jgi:hypothetical protein